MADPFAEFAGADPDAAEPELTVMEAIAWAMRKHAIMRDGRTADQAEAIVQREMAEQRDPRWDN